MWTADLEVWDGSVLTVRGDIVLGDGATIDSFGLPSPGLFTILDTGSFTLEAPDSSATVQGGFANHGQITVTAGQHLMMLGASPEDAHPDQFSTGRFTGAPGAFFNVSGTELRNGALLEHVTWVDHITVPEGNTVNAVASSLVDVVVEGSLESDGATTLDGAEVTGSVIAMSGTLYVPSLAPATLRDLTLTSGKWIAGPAPR